MRYLKFFGKIVLISIMAFAILYVSGRVFIPKYASENEDGRVTGDFYAEKGPIDVIFVGSSTVYNAYIPAYLFKEYGFTSYDRANASQTLWQSYYIIRDAVRYNKPSMVVLDTSFMKYGEEFVEEPANRKTIDGMKLSVNKLGAVASSMYEEETLASYLFPVLRFHSRWNDLKQEDITYAFKDPKVTYEGYIPETGSDPEADYREMGVYDNFTGFPEKAERYLQMIIRYCREEGIELVLAKTPTFMDNWYIEYDEELSRIAEENGITYIDFDPYIEDIGLIQREDYVDGHSHLNIKGAEKFSDYAGKYLSETYGLPDRRNDEKLSGEWQKKYEIYENAKANGIAKD